MFRHALAILSLLVTATSARAATPSCRALEAAPRVGPAQDVVVWASAIAEAVMNAEGRLDPAGRAARVAFVDLPGATGAWYCRARDTVYVARTLLDYAHLGRASDGADFLAFVVGHELAHRRFDGDAVAAGARAFGDVGVAQPDREAATDERAAFLVALAENPFDGRGFSPWKLARSATLEHYLADEVGLAPGSAEGARRTRALRAALERMGELAEVYELALALAFAPLAATGDGIGLAPRDRAAELLAGLDAALNAPGAWARVPELSLVRALLHAQRAARARGVRCDVAFSGQAALSPFDAWGARGADPAALARELAAGRRALAEAVGRGLGAELVAPVAACLDRVAAAPGAAWVAPAAAATAGRAGDDLAVERLAAEAEAACAPGAEGAGRTLGLGGGAVVWARAGGGRRCYRVGAGAGLVVALLAPHEPAAVDLAAWRSACHVFGHGVGDDGTEAFGAYCAGVDSGRMQGWTLFARGGRVVRVVRVLGG